MRELYYFDYEALKVTINSSGMKQKAIAAKAGIKENHLCLILQGKRKCEAGEYVSLCNALAVEPVMFMKEVKQDENWRKGIS